MEGGFVHRENSDGTIDSICLICFLTVATAQTEPELVSVEASHQCDPYELATLKHRLGADHQQESQRK